MLKVQSAKNHIKDLFDYSDNEGSTVTWLRGWICGYTDRDHEYNEEESDKVRGELSDYLYQLKIGKIEE